MRIIISLTLVLSVFLVSAAQAEDRPLAKLERGVVNVLTAPAEIPKQVRAYWIEGSQYTYHISFWIFSGLVKGAVEKSESKAAFLHGSFGSGKSHFMAVSAR